MDKVLSEAVKTITPNVKEREILKKFAKRVTKLLNKHGHTASVEGSFAKDTWISGNHDLDVFMYFDPETPRKELEKDAIKIGSSVIKELGGVPELAYSEHPYTRSQINGIDLDIVPCYQIEDPEEKATSVDRTPFHTKYIEKNLSDKQKSEVRLLKQFTKGIGVYSAKEKVRGFSGYLCELLILQYKNFKKLAKESQEWTDGLVIDLEKYYKNRKQAYKKFKDVLVVIDPTDKDRNVAAALNEDNFDILIHAFKQFLQKPTIQFFFPNLIEPYSKEKMKKEIETRGDMFILKFKTPKVQEDILYSQLRKTIRSMKREFEEHDFNVMQTDLVSNTDTYLLFELENKELPEIKILEGPPLSVPKKHQDAFVEKHKAQNPWIKNKHWQVKIKRQFINAEDLIKEILKKPKEIGIPKYVVKSIEKGNSIITNKGIEKEYEKEFARFLTRYLSNTMPWEW